MSLEALKRNGHHLELGDFELAGDNGIPIIQPVQLNEQLPWVRFNHALRETDRSRYGVHFFMDDYLFERVWRDPDRYGFFLRDFPAVMSPDFSLFADYPKAVQVYNHWRKHQLAAYWQKLGLTVIPSVSWVGKDSFSWCFDGEPVGGTVAVSSVGTQKGKEAQSLFLDGYTEMLDRLKPTKIIFYGQMPKECADMTAAEIEQHSPFYETFTRGLDFSAKGR